MISTKKLNDKLSIPTIGFGTWQIDNHEDVAAIKASLELGYRHIDTADIYGNHKEVGQALKESGVAREDIFLTTKVWTKRLHREDVLVDIDRFLDELDTSYLDLVLIHWPNREVPIVETLKALNECKEAGKIRAIGVSNFTKHHIQEALATGIEIVNNQVEMHPSLDQKELREYCAENNIVVTAYSPLRSGDMSLPLIQELADKYERTPAQIILSWLLSLDVVVLVQSSKPERIEQNLAASEFVMSPEDIQKYLTYLTGNVTSILLLLSLIIRVGNKGSSTLVEEAVFKYLIFWCYNVCLKIFYERI